MKAYTKIVFDTESGKMLECEWHEYAGPVWLLKGPSADQRALAFSQKQFYDTLTANFNTMFAGQTATLAALTKAFQPILAAGPTQVGFAPAQEAAMRTGESEITAGTYRDAARALNESLAARGGGNVFLPSGAEEQIRAGLAVKAAETEAAGQREVTLANYAAGRQNYNLAAQVLGGVAKTYDPSGFAKETTGAGMGAAGTAADIAREEQAASPWTWVGGVLGGAASRAGSLGTGG